MIKLLFKNFIAFLFFAIASEPKAAETISHPELQEISLEPRRYYGLIQDTDVNKNTLGARHLDANHPAMQALMAAPSLPASVDLRSGFSEPFDQGRLGSCTGQALVGAVLFDLKKQGQKKPDMRSVLYLYWQERKLEGKIGQDAGATLTSGIKVLHSLGVCRESLWPYDISTYTNTPTAAMDADAATCKDTDSDPIHTDSVDIDISVIKGILSQSCPIVGGIRIYESFESFSVRLTGNVPMPKQGEKLIGGHAVVFAGYDDSKQAFLMRNSWGTSWGIGGYFWLPYDYVRHPDYAFDCWKVDGTSIPALDPNPPASKKCCIIL
jgi:C1A family cysteine protease